MLTEQPRRLRLKHGMQRGCMQTNGDISRTYARAMGVRAQMIEFRDLLAEQEGWTLASKFLFGRFEVAFRFFLDAPTADKLETVVSFEADMMRIARNVPALARWRRFT